MFSRRPRDRHGDTPVTIPIQIARTSAQELHARLAEDILAGRLAPGAKLKLHDLIAAYDSGMSPVREALASLAGRGLVVQDGQRGFRVAPASVADLHDVIATRVRLESMAMELAIRHGDTAWEADILASFHMLQRHVRSAEQLIDERWEDLHRAYHVSLIAACGSPRLRDYCLDLHRQFDRYRRIAVQARGRHADLDRRDGDIVAATLARDAKAASALLARHIEESGAAVVEMFADCAFGAG